MNERFAEGYWSIRSPGRVSCIDLPGAPSIWMPRIGGSDGASYKPKRRW